MPMPDANMITVPYSPKSCRMPYGPSINAKRFLFVCLLSSAVKPPLDSTNRDIVKPFISRSHHDIIKGWPRSPVKTPNFGIERKIDCPALTRHGLGTVTSTCSTFDGSTSDLFKDPLFESRVATAVVYDLPKTKFLNANRAQPMAVAIVHRHMPIRKNNSAGFFEETWRQMAIKTTTDRTRCELRNHSYNARRTIWIERKKINPKAELAWCYISAGVSQEKEQNMPQLP